MLEGDNVVREISLVGLAETYRSAVRMVRRRRLSRKPRVPVARAALHRADGSLVVITSRDGRLHIGRLWMADDHVQLWQIIQGIPCRQRFAFKDVVSCYVYSDTSEWDEPTQPTSLPRETSVANARPARASTVRPAPSLPSGPTAQL